MNILHIAECAGGVDRYLEMLLPRLKNEYEQMFVCSQNYDISKYKGMIDKVEQIYMSQSFSPIKIYNIVKNIRKLIIKYRPDIVYCHSSFSGGLGRLACIGLDCKVVYNPHGWAFNIKGIVSGKSVVYKIIETLLARSTDKIVCISKAEYDSAIKNGIDDGRKLEIIENGINVLAVRNAKAMERGELGIPDDAYVIGMIGRLTPQKAPDIFIRAARIISMKIPNTYYIIVGNGEEEEHIKRYAEENGLHLIVTGWTDTPYSYLKLFDVAVLLSRWEGFGLAIAEYMAAEKNIVATRVDAIPTIVDDGKDGLLVDVDSPKEAADKVLFYYTHSEEAKLMRVRAFEKVKMKYDISRVVLQHKQMFNKLLYEKN